MSAVGAFGWPLTNSPAFPGEKILCCPQCSSTDLVQGCHPGRDGRIGSPGTADYVRCRRCQKYASKAG